MHFRCVFTLLQWCVLVGLDWAEPMMLFMLHITCSCIFMHMYLHLSLYWYWYCWCFFVFLSLSLSFVSCSMAPKWKSTPSQNPLCFGASSSFDTTPSHIRFCDDKARKDFSENFSWRGIHSERQVILSDFSDTNLPTVIYSRGWESLCGILVICPSMIVQEFYSNMHGFDPSVPYFVTRVRGTRIEVTSNIVSEVLHVLRVAHPDYPDCDRLSTVSKDELLYLFCETPSSWGNYQNTLLGLCKRFEIP